MNYAIWGYFLLVLTLSARFGVAVVAMHVPTVIQEQQQWRRVQHNMPYFPRARVLRILRRKPSTGIESAFLSWQPLSTQSAQSASHFDYINAKHSHERYTSRILAHRYSYRYSDKDTRIEAIVRHAPRW